MKVEKVFVTPAMADDWLRSLWDRQRPLREGHVAKLMADLLAGRFYFGPQAIAFDQRGRLIDGQHRLESCRRSGVGFWTLVAKEVDERVAPKLGQVEGWSLAALLNLHDGARQFGAQHNVKAAASIGAFLFKQLSGKRHRPSEDDALSVILHFRDSIVWALDSCSLRLLSKVPVRAALVVMHHARPGTFEIFANKIRTGVGLTHSDPALTLRDYLMSETSVQGADNVEWQFYKVLRAGEAHVMNDKLHKLMMPKDTSGAVRQQMDFFLGSSARLADKLGLLATPAQGTGSPSADGTSAPFPVNGL